MALCAFWLGDRCFALDVHVVGELVIADELVPVPHAPPAVLGVFALRGAPIACVDLGQVLGLPDGRGGAQRNVHALVLRNAAAPLAAVAIDRADAVVDIAELDFAPRSAGEHGAVLGFVTLPAPRADVITVLDPAVAIDRVQALRYR